MALMAYLAHSGGLGTWAAVLAQAHLCLLVASLYLSPDGVKGRSPIHRPLMGLGSPGIKDDAVSIEPHLAVVSMSAIVSSTAGLLGRTEAVEMGVLSLALWSLVRSGEGLVMPSSLGSSSSDRSSATRSDRQS